MIDLDRIRIIAVDICPHTSLDAFLAVSRYQDDGYRLGMFPVPRRIQVALYVHTR